MQFRVEGVGEKLNFIALLHVEWEIFDTKATGGRKQILKE